MRLRVGEWRLELLPELGGAVASLSHRGADLLRPTPVGATDILQTACFPLVPFSNRIDWGRFRFGGEDIVLNPTPGFSPHALHGDGWRRPWTVAAADAGSVVLGLDHPAGDWPWVWSARQRFDLSDEGLTVTLSLTNGDQRPMPAGLGLHPYFVREPETRLTLAASGVWVIDDSLIPVSLKPPSATQDWSAGPRVSDAPFVDNAYAGWGGQATVTADARTVAISASSNARWAHVYVPTGETYFCVEPVTHRPDALNAPAGEDSGVTILGPGETLSMSMTISLAGV